MYPESLICHFEWAACANLTVVIAYLTLLGFLGLKNQIAALCVDVVLDIIFFMKDYSLKMVLAGLLGVVFATLLIVTAFIVPLDNKTKYTKAKKKSVNRLGRIAEGMRGK